jgi:hypothetical protein
MCASKVEIERLGAIGDDVVGVDREMGAALSRQPDVVLVAITPVDLLALDLHWRVLAREQPLPPGRLPAPLNRTAHPLLAHLIPHGTDSLRIKALLRQLNYLDTDYLVKM